MPQAIPFIPQILGAAEVIGATTAAWLTIASSIGVGLYERERAQSAERRARNLYKSPLQDRLITVRSGVSARRYALGTVRAGGTLMYADTVGDNKEHLDMVTAICCNQSFLVAYYINDQFSGDNTEFPIPERYGSRLRTPASEGFPNVDGGASGKEVVLTCSSNIPIPGTVRAFILEDGSRESTQVNVLGVDGRDVTVFAPKGVNFILLRFDAVVYDSVAGGGGWLQVVYKTGHPDQTTEDWPNIETPLWTSEHRLRGVSYFRSVMIWNSAIFSEGVPDVTAVIKGSSIDGYPFYDPRDESNPTYTDNPAILAGWWMTLPRFLGGCGIPEDWIDWDWIADAANVCDELITVRKLDGSGYEQIKRYQCHTILSTEQSPLENLETILSAMNGRKAFTAGKYRIVAGAFRPATITITDANVIGTKPIKRFTARGNDAPPNVVTAQMADAARNWSETSPPPVRNEDYIHDDGREIPLDVKLPATTDTRQANYLQGVQLEANRPADSIELTVDGIGENIAIFDCVQLSLANRSMYDGKTFEVLSIIDHWNGEFTLALAEIREQTWALDADRFTPIDPVEVPSRDYLWNVPALTGLTADLQTPQTLPDGNSLTQVVLAWDAPPTEYVNLGGYIEIRYAEAMGQWISAGTIPGDSLGTTVTAHLIDGGNYVFQVRVVNALGSPSDWTSVWVSVEGEALEVGGAGGLFTWTNEVGVETTGTTITKTGEGGAWDAGAHSLQSYSNGCFCSARAGETTRAKMFGLNNDPAVDSNHTGIDFAWYARTSGIARIQENGTFIGQFGSYTSDTVFSIKYDGESVRYEKDGVVVRTVTGQSGRRFFLDTSLYTSGASWVDVVFGPMGGVGPQGASAQLIRLTSSAQAFVFPASGGNVATPTSITFTARRTNISSATVWSTSPSVSLSGTGDTRVLHDDVFAASGASAISVTASAGGFSDTITVHRLDLVAGGADGLSVAELTIYRRATSAPSTPTGGSFNFTTQALTAPSGWSASIPSGNNPIYASRAVASVSGVGGTDSTLSWSSPVLVAQDGSGVDIVFRRSATQPATPSSSSGVPSGWFGDVSSVTGTGTLWSSVGQRSNAGQNYTWDTPIRVEGQNGADGLSVAELTIYRRASSAPSTPSGGSYNFSNQTLTAPSSWSSSIPAGSTPVYASRGVAAITGASGTDSSITWSAPTLVLSDGQSVNVIFRRAASQPSTPSASSSVPSGWFDDVGDVTGTDALWSSFGTRANASQNWTWQTPARVEGENALQLILTNESHTLAADPDGVVGDFSGASGLAFLYEGTTDRTSAATFSIVSATNCTAQINTSANSPVSGQPKGFYRVTAVSADQAEVTIRATYNGNTYDKKFTVVRARAGVPGDGTNLLRVDQWQVGTTGTQGDFTHVDSASKNAVVLGGAGTAPVGPFGITEPLWQVTADGVDASNEGEGGWSYRDIDIDPLRTYRASVWARVNALDGRVYFGAATSGETLNLNGSENTNPYYISSHDWGEDGPTEANKWYLLVGILHGNSYTGNYSGVAGIYDPVNGKKIVDGTEFKLASDATTQTHRAYFYDADSTSSRMWFARPRFEEVNGNEPSIDELMGFVPTTPWKARGGCLASTSTIIKSDGVDAWDSDVYSIQGYRTCHLQFKPGQTNAAMMIGLNSDPLANESYASLDRAWYCANGGVLQIYENGAIVAGSGGELGTYTTSTELSITYDGSTVRYYKDRVLKRSVNVANQLYYFDSSFHKVGGSINFVRWGPGTAFESISTGDIDPGAATEVYLATTASVTVSHNPMISTTSVPILTMNLTAPVDGLWLITASFDCEITAGSTLAQSVIAGLRLQSDPDSDWFPNFTGVADVREGLNSYSSVTVLDATAGLPIIIGLFKWASVQASTFKISNLSMRVELIKR